MKKTLTTVALVAMLSSFTACASIESMFANPDSETISSIEYKKKVGATVKDGVKVSIPNEWKRSGNDGKGEHLVSYQHTDSGVTFYVKRSEVKKAFTGAQLTKKPYTYVGDANIGGRTGFVMESAKGGDTVMYVSAQDTTAKTGYYLYEFRLQSKLDAQTHKARMSEIIASVHWVTDAEYQSNFAQEAPRPLEQQAVEPQQ